jgi:Mg2+/Co2+ transporter CorB
LEIPEGEYSTLAGYIVVNNEDIPNQNEVVFVDQFEIRILKASNKRIDLVRLRVLNREGV